MNKLKKLAKSYKKKLTKTNNNLIDWKVQPLDYFIQALEYKRDFLFVQAELKNELTDDNYNLITIITALEEYYNYKECLKKYYDVTGSSVVHKAGYTAESAQEAFQKEQTYHWQNFWGIVATYSEAWSSIC